MSAQLVDPAALRAWWRTESWMDLPEDPNPVPASFDVALAEGERLRRLGEGLGDREDATPLIHALLQAQPWEESYGEPLHALATCAIYSRTPLSLIDRAFARVIAHTSDPKLWLRARRNQGTAASMRFDVKGIQSATDDVLRMLAVGEPWPLVESSILTQCSRASLFEQNYSQAWHFAEQAAAIGDAHEGGRLIMERFWAQAALCATLDKRPETAEAWLRRLSPALSDSVFWVDTVKALCLHLDGQGEEAAAVARRTLMLWPGFVVRRPTAYLARYLVELLAGGLDAFLAPGARWL